jgi:hypothetical protein
LEQKTSCLFIAKSILLDDLELPKHVGRMTRRVAQPVLGQNYLHNALEEKSGLIIWATSEIFTNSCKK